MLSFPYDTGSFHRQLALDEEFEESDDDSDEDGDDDDDDDEDGELEGARDRQVLKLEMQSKRREEEVGS